MWVARVGGGALPSIMAAEASLASVTRLPLRIHDALGVVPNTGIRHVGRGAGWGPLVSDGDWGGREVGGTRGWLRRRDLYFCRFFHWGPEDARADEVCPTALLQSPSVGTWWPAGSTSSGRGLARRARNHSIDRTRRFRGALRFALASDRRRFTRVPSRGRITARDSSAEPSSSDPTRDCDTQGTVVRARSLGRGPFRRSSPLYALRFASKSDDPSGSWTVTARVLLRGPRAPCSRSNV
ncbi:hypothetical protein B296_00036032 [Ensete ventricosum]|uniref:Uncharacterized protein n=1 Tax=Ensete ventricosum TaxID=4639 RepID=A0A426YWQ8_ENSVE|nr:hypothetical protein B296_00036032 [Ensete ventricosum]